MDDRPIPNDEFRAVMNDAVNQWFRKWRDTPLTTQEDWNHCIHEWSITAGRHEFQFTADIGAVLVAELERRNPRE